MEKSKPELPIAGAELRRDATDPCLILIGGRSGCGKTTVVDSLLARFPSVYVRVPSVTSRARRPGEGDAEYRFVTREAIQAMHQRGELLSLDEAYGENYGMSRLALEEIFHSGRFAVKEIHVKNHAIVLARMPHAISLLLELADERWSAERKDFDPVRAQRLAADRDYYAALDPRRFDIVHRIQIAETPDMTADALHAELHALIATRRQGTKV